MSVTRSTCLLAITLGAGVPAHGKVTVGEHVRKTMATPHPYEGTGASPLFTARIHHPQATYIAPHFAVMDLAPGDRVVVRSPDGRQERTYIGLGRHGLGRSADGFFATHVKGDTAIVELFAAAGSRGFGFTIDAYGRGYSVAEIERFWARGLGEKMNLPRPPRGPESICGKDDSREAKCYQASEPQIYDESRAVARLLLYGAESCTGWLVGTAGHVMTNRHCIVNQAYVDNSDFEFMAEGATCATDCSGTGACPGVIEASGGTLVQVNAPLDYSLVLPDTSTGTGVNLPATYGFMQLRASGPVLNERMYLPGHPGLWGKRISVESTHPADPGGFALVTSLSEPTCSGGPPEVGYFADTQEGSSGSPVLAYADHRVVALHHCGGFPECTSTGGARNRGIAIPLVIADLGFNLPPGSVCIGPAAPTGVTATATAPNQITVSWTATPGAASYEVLRATGACPGGPLASIATGVAGTTYQDNTVSGTITYSYVVRALDGDSCPSAMSTCDDAATTGSCTVAPTFAGLASASNGQAGLCTINLSWNPATAHCGTTVRYNVYGSPTAGFTPGPANVLAACQTATTYQDLGLGYAVRMYYKVRAEDAAAGGSGPCGGNEETNLVERSAVPTGPLRPTFLDDMESGLGNWSVSGSGGGTNWAIVDTASHSPTHSAFVPDPSGVSDRQLATSAAVTVAPGSVLEFWHRYGLDIWFGDFHDGGVLEYSLDGITWVDILAGHGTAVPANPDRFLQNGYDGELSSCCSNPLAGRLAWSGDNGAFEEVRVDLSEFAGQTVLFRFRFGSDSFLADAGWWLDDFRRMEGTRCAIPVELTGFEVN